MASVLEFALLGGHLVESEIGEEPCYDAMDFALRLSDGNLVAFGLRTRGYFSTVDDKNGLWGEYRPLPVTLDLGSVKYWNFNEILWLGPSPWPCLVWSNAECLSLRAVNVLFSPAMPGRIVLGPNERGLPPLEAVGVPNPTEGEFVTLDPPAAFKNGLNVEPNSYDPTV